MLVTCIIPTRNRVEMLNRALRSVAEQTYNNLEIIIIDDCSDDQTYNVCQEWCKSDNRIKYIKNKKPLGGSGARNKGILSAQGEYIAFLDDDDEWLPEKIESQVSVIKSTGKGFVFCGRENIKNGKKKVLVSNHKIIFLNDILWENKIGSTSSIIIDANLANDLLFDENLTAAQDYDFYVRALSNVNAAINLPKPLIKYYEHDSVRITTNPEKKYKGHRRFLLKHLNKMNKYQKRYHIYRYRLVEWSRNGNRNFRYLFNGLKFYPWWSNFSEIRRVAANLKKRFDLREGF